MADSLSDLGRGFWSAYRAARRHRDRTGEWPTAWRVMLLADNHGCDLWALLAMTRRELPGLEVDDEQEGALHLISLDCGQPVLAPSPDSLLALGMIATDATITLPDGSLVERHEFEQRAADRRGFHLG